MIIEYIVLDILIHDSSTRYFCNYSYYLLITVEFALRLIGVYEVGIYFVFENFINLNFLLRKNKR